MKSKNLIYYLTPILVACGGEDSEAGEEKPVDTTNTTEVVEVTNTDLIEPKNVSIFSLGLPVPAQLPSELSTRKAIHHHKSSGTTTEVDMVVVYNPIEDMIDLQLEENPSKAEADRNVVEMIVHSDYYRTATGVGVNSSIEELLSTYADCQFWYTADGERFVAQSVQLQGIQFIFNYDACLKMMEPGADSTALLITDFNPGSPIEMVRIF